MSKELTELLGLGNLIAIDFTQDDNFEMLKSVFEQWSTPFKFIEKGQAYNGVQANYQAHKNKENYIRFLVHNLPPVLPVCLKHAQEKAQKLNRKH